MKRLASPAASPSTEGPGPHNLDLFSRSSPALSLCDCRGENRPNNEYDRQSRLLGWMRFVPIESNLHRVLKGMRFSKDRACFTKPIMLIVQRLRRETNEYEESDFGCLDLWQEWPHE